MFDINTKAVMNISQVSLDMQHFFHLIIDLNSKCLFINDGYHVLNAAKNISQISPFR